MPRNGRDDFLQGGFDRDAMASALADLDRLLVDSRWRGVPSSPQPLSLGDLAAKGWNILAGDLPAPVAVIRQSALEHNARWINRLLDRFGLLLAPHAKTSMCPHIFALQARTGSWGLTVANAQQAEVAAAFGCRRIIVANQLVGKSQIRAIFDLLLTYSTLEVFVFVDSGDGLQQLAKNRREEESSRRLHFILEVGFKGGRTGCRSSDEANRMLDTLQQTGLPLSGIGGYEGLIAHASGSEDPAAVERYFDQFAEVAAIAQGRDAFDTGATILTAGGSSYFDVVGRRLADIDIGRPVIRILRSGCYITHDCGTYGDHQAELRKRNPSLAEALGELAPALFVWGLVQSRPEQDLALVTVGKRDVGFDAGLPVLVWHYRHRQMSSPRPLTGDWELFRLNDQHGYLRIPANADIKIGDLVCFGVSHPCTTFDRWRLIHLVDDDWNCVGAMPTFF